MTLLKKPMVWLGVTVSTIAVSLIVIFSLGLNWGIDFVGGSLLEIQGSSEQAAPATTLLRERFDLDASIQTTQEESLIVRLPEISQERKDEIVSALQEEQIIEGQELRFESIGPTIGQELRRKSILAITVVVVGMIIYLAYTFRTMKGLIEPWKFGVAAVVALLHDILVVAAAFAIFGKLWGAPVDTLFVTALLAILGYSINDTIILFARMRTQWRHAKRASLLDVINQAISATFGRSFNTSFTTLLVLFALFLFGGTTIHWFIAALIVGTIAGTYSSWFIAPPVLIFLSKRS
ncbi:MAG: protein translocase subunit SecF [Candidatus Andersenbacteria bacterium]